MPAWAWIAVGVLLALAAVALRAAVHLLRHIQGLSESIEQAGTELRSALESVNAEVEKAREGLERIAGGQVGPDWDGV